MRARQSIEGDVSLRPLAPGRYQLRRKNFQLVPPFSGSGQQRRADSRKRTQRPPFWSARGPFYCQIDAAQGRASGRGGDPNAWECGGGRLKSPFR
jgi:hypothetical protein